MDSDANATNKNKYCKVMAGSSAKLMNKNTFFINRIKDFDIIIYQSDNVKYKNTPAIILLTVFCSIQFEFKSEFM